MNCHDRRDTNVGEIVWSYGSYIAGEFKGLSWGRQIDTFVSQIYCWQVSTIVLATTFKQNRVVNMLRTMLSSISFSPFSFISASLSLISSIFPESCYLYFSFIPYVRKSLPLIVVLVTVVHRC